MRREAIAWTLVGLLAAAIGAIVYTGQAEPSMSPGERAARQVHEKFGRDAYLAYTVEGAAPDTRCGMLYMVEYPRNERDYIAYALPTMFISRADGLMLIGDPRIMADNPRADEFQAVLTNECPKLDLPPLWGPPVE